MSVLQTVDTSHEDMIHDAQLDYYGTTLATASSDESIKIFDVRNRRQVLIAHLKDHQGPVWSISWSHPMYGSLLASCGYDKKVLIWRELNGQWETVYEYSDHTSSVNSVSWAPHEYGLMLACGSSDGSISILTCTGNDSWSVKRIMDAHAIGVNTVSWAPAINADFMFNPAVGQTANTLMKRLISGGCDAMVKIWREDTNAGGVEWLEESRLEAHTDWVRDVAWAPSLNVTRAQIASCGQDGRVIVWQCITSKQDTVEQLDTLNLSGGDPTIMNKWRPFVIHTYPDVVWHVSWSATGNILAVSGGDNKVTLWKETLEGGWIALSEVQRGHAPASLLGADDNSQVSNVSPAQLAA